MSRARVAENSRVRRSAGEASRMNSRSSRKPRSSISSASSSTTTAGPRCRGCRAPGGRAGGPGCRPRCGSRRPGRTSRAAGPCRRRRRPACRRLGVEPLQLAVNTCRASSRVGATIRASGRFGPVERSASPSRVRRSQAIGDGLAGAGLGRDQQVGAVRPRCRLRGRRPAPGSAQDSLAAARARSSAGFSVGKGMVRQRTARLKSLRRPAPCSPDAARGDRPPGSASGPVPLRAAR
jgi:hypothetical protein